MRFRWPGWKGRERLLSIDSKCSTASHLSLASNVSFNDASYKYEIGLAGDHFTAVSSGIDFERTTHDPSTADFDSGHHLEADWPERETVVVTPQVPPLLSADDRQEALRALSQLDGEAPSDIAASGTCLEHAAPIAHARDLRDETASGDGLYRHYSSTWCRFVEREVLGRHPSLSLGRVVTPPIVPCPSFDFSVATGGHALVDQLLAGPYRAPSSPAAPSSRRLTPPMPTPAPYKSIVDEGSRFLLDHPAGRAECCLSGYLVPQGKVC